MLAYPPLINRSIVINPSGNRLSRPSERVLDISPQPPRGLFKKEDAAVVVDSEGKIAKSAGT